MASPVLNPGRMPEHEQDQKTEQPTEKHLTEATERGQFAKSPEMHLAFALAAALIVFSLTATSVAREIGSLTVSLFTQLGATRMTLDTAPAHLGVAAYALGRMLLPVLVACAGATLLAGSIQSGFQLTPKAFGIHWEHLDPAAGWRRVFSQTALAHFGLDLLKLGAVGAALYGGVKGVINDPLFCAPVETAYLGQFLHHAALRFLGRLLVALGGIAAVSYAYEIFRTRREQMMTRQEVKDERRNTEGDALLKAAQRRLARRLLQKQMLSAVPTADVVVTNPTHYAVALKYERGIDTAPVVLAKGENRFAQRIKALAAEHEVPVMENPPVARVLHAMGRVGEAIPAELYQAVAEILAVVYRTHRYYFYRLPARRAQAAG
ncbi:MAG: EscU/YscU/HrcU family type III secretion system export apparatus switch protein [Opitutaceae bacterium]|nr:EscU/YscU/HrcU family type III secretion system export apparatus switch protein [Opitutaceae bacterium]